MLPTVLQLTLGHVYLQKGEIQDHAGSLRCPEALLEPQVFRFAGDTERLTEAMATCGGTVTAH